jgi:hypothetical protein
MTQMNQETKKLISSVTSVLMKKYGIKGYLSIKKLPLRNDVKYLVLNISEGKIDFLNAYLRNNPNRLNGEQHIHFIKQGNGSLHFYGVFSSDAADGTVEENGHSYIYSRPWSLEQFDGIAKKFLEEIIEAMNHGNENFNREEWVDKGIGWVPLVNIGWINGSEYKYNGDEA